MTKRYLPPHCRFTGRCCKLPFTEVCTRCEDARLASYRELQGLEPTLCQVALAHVPGRPGIQRAASAGTRTDCPSTSTKPPAGLGSSEHRGLGILGSSWNFMEVFCSAWPRVCVKSASRYASKARSPTTTPAAAAELPATTATTSGDPPLPRVVSWAKATPMPATSPPSATSGVLRLMLFQAATCSNRAFYRGSKGCHRLGASMFSSCFRA